jgi:hypothetical protein
MHLNHSECTWITQILRTITSEYAISTQRFRMLYWNNSECRGLSENTWIPQNRLGTRERSSERVTARRNRLDHLNLLRKALRVHTHPPQRFRIARNNSKCTGTTTEHTQTALRMHSERWESPRTGTNHSKHPQKGHKNTQKDPASTLNNCDTLRIHCKWTHTTQNAPKSVHKESRVHTRSFRVQRHPE